jgi:hypothetical protein
VGLRARAIGGRAAVVRCGLAVAAVVAGMGTLAACGDDDDPASKEPAARSIAVPARGTDKPAASAAGGACQLLDFYAVAQFVGVTFEVAAAAQKDATATCVLQRGGAAGYPDLTLAVTPTTVPAAAFKSTAAPQGAGDLPALGQAAYQLVRPAAGTDPTGPGPAVEIGWLSKKNQLMIVRYRLAGDKPQADAQALVPQVTELARYLEPA